MSENVSPHDFSNDGSVLVIWLSLKDRVIRSFSSQSKSGEGIHDQVDPEHLNGSQWGFSKDGRSEEDDEHGNNVDGKLELKELSNVIIDVSSELKSNNNGGEVMDLHTRKRSIISAGSRPVARAKGRNAHPGKRVNGTESQSGLRPSRR